MERRQVPAAIGRKPGDPFHAEQVIAGVGSGASKICRHRVRERSVGPRMERDLRWQLGIIDQRTDPRIDFVGGIRGTRALEAQVDAGEAALAISLYPTTVEQLMAVADRGHIMPPKSTWFEPKLLSGLFVHPLD